MALTAVEILGALLQVQTRIRETHSASSVLQEIADAAMHVFGADSCRICRFNSTTHLFDLQASAGRSRDWTHLPRRDGNGIGMRVLTTGVRVWTDRIEQIHPAVRKAGITCLGTFPLQPIAGNAVGVMYLHFVKNPKFTQEMFGMAELFAYHAGLAIQFADIREKDKGELSEARKGEFDALAIVALSSLAAQFAHRLSNAAGTLPIIIEDIEGRLRKAGVDDEGIHKRFADLRADTEQLLGMARQLRPRNDVGRPARIDLCQVIERAIGSADLDPAIVVRKDIPPALPPVSAVETLLVDIFVNLLQNAAEAHAKSIHITVLALPEQKTIDVLVSDDGDGIAASDLGKIFVPLYSTKRGAQPGGLRGIGLWVSRVQLAKWGGSVSVRSTLGKGSIFVVSLKVATPE